MIDLALRSLLVSAVALLALALARRASASIRHVVAVAGLAATLAVPLFLATLPSVRLAVLPQPSAAPPIVVQSSNVVAVAVPAAPTLVPAPEAPPRPFPWGAVWAAGSLVLILRWAFGLLWLAFRLRRAPPVEGLGVGVPVLESSVFRVPVTAWTGRPAIVLPLDWREWPAERRDVALRHELAHVRRGDGLSLLLARLACAALWPNPLVWILARAESRLAERAADDLVLQDGVPAPRYAEALLGVAREPRTHGSLPALGMAGCTQVAHRVEMILNPETPRTLVPRNARRAVLVVALLAAVPAALLGFDPPAQTVRPKPKNAIAVTAIADPLAFVLRCEVVRAPQQSMVLGKGTTAKPVLTGADTTTVLRAPDLYTRNGIPAALKVTLDGIERMIELRPTTGDDLRYTLQVGMSMPFQNDRLGYGDAFYRSPANGWVRYPIHAFHGKYTGYQMLIQVSPYTNASRPSTPTMDAGRPLLIACKVLHWKDGPMPTSSVSLKEPGVGRPGSFKVVAEPKILTRENVPGSLEIQGGNPDLKVSAQVMAGPGGKLILHLDGKLRWKGGPVQGVSYFVSLREGEWYPTPYRDANGNDHGDQLFVRVTRSN